MLLHITPSGHTTFMRHCIIVMYPQGINALNDGTAKVLLQTTCMRINKERDKGRVFDDNSRLIFSLLSLKKHMLENTN